MVWIISEKLLVVSSAILSRMLSAPSRIFRKMTFYRPPMNTMSA